MQPSDDVRPEEKYKGIRAKADAFFIKSTSLLPQQMLLRIGDYSLAAAPAYFSLDEISLLLVLSTSELTLFSRYVNGNCSLVLAFDLPGSKEAVRFFVRAALAALEPMHGRANACMAALRLKTVPPIYSEILVSFFGEVEARRQKRELLSGRWLEPKKLKTPSLSAELLAGQTRIPVELSAISTSQARLTLASDLEAVEDEGLALRVVKDGQPFTLSCSASGKTDLAAGEVLLELDFSNELVSLIEDNLKSTTTDR
ncbi:MAG TPA: hypothetical protein VMV90_10820 [Rectinemataceae bacterium]|nr:hypothetical protein [Rectinemataceae bacterium]